MININSSLMMPSNTPAATVVDAGNAVYFTLRALNLHRLKDTFSTEIAATKTKLFFADEEIRTIK